MKENKEICGKCLHHRKQNEEWICTNPDSDSYGCWTEYNDTCEDFEARVNSGLSTGLGKKFKNS